MRNTLTAAAAAALVFASVTAHAAIRITTSAIEFTPNVDITIIDSLRFPSGDPVLGDVGGNLQTGFPALRPNSPLIFGPNWYTYNGEVGALPDLLGLKHTFHAANFRPGVVGANGQITEQVAPTAVSIAFKAPASQFGFDYYSPFSDLTVTVRAGKQTSSYVFAKGSGFAGIIDVAGFDSIVIGASFDPTTNGFAADNFRYSATNPAAGGGDPLAPIPEPQTYAMLLAGLLCVSWIARARTATAR